ncbi:ASCH domain-containing protein [Novosphingobium guangzhouense]|uniref:ASCH domain-containing protein n=1 Tax=Novosphingobium guangzhouense TaxID=1850347 RepID=A0A2K2G5Y5_9SPHN|nr:ASCH domain-containing protein [Novosphingobium guangzhouense]PNU06447.1 hypothetical protein A8V01_02570 [Novosphingobium guangzhouense]
MKALTIWQPWASLIVAGAKPYEFRGWRAPRSLIGQRIVIHAAARKIALPEVVDLFVTLRDRDLSKDHRADAAMTCLHAEKALPILARAWSPGDNPLPMSAGIGTAIIGEPRNGLEIAAEFGVPRANDSDRDQHANWGWPMLEVEPWDLPIAMKGRQGFWNWLTPDEVIA